MIGHLIYCNIARMRTPRPGTLRLTIKTVIAPILVLCALAALVYYPAVDGGFFYDDNYYVAANPHIRDISNLGEFFLDNRTLASIDWKDPIYRPVRTLWYALIHQAFGLNARAFHIVGLFIHALNAILVYFLALSLLKRDTTAVMPALLCALVFLLHPAQVESASWISAQGATLACAFALLSILVGLSRAGRFASATTGGIFYLLAAFSYEAAIGVPALFATILWVKYGKTGLKERWPAFAAFAVAFIVYALCHRASVKHIEFLEPWGGSIPYHLTAVAYSMLLSLKVTLFPILVKIEYIPRLWGSVFELRAFFCVLSVLFVILFGLYGILRRSMWAVVFAAWLIFYLPSSNLIPNSILFGDRFLYLPLVGISLSAGLIAGYLPHKKLATAGLVIMLASFAILSHGRAEIWSDPMQLWTKTARAYPWLVKFEGTEAKDFRIGLMRGRLLNFNGSEHITRRAFSVALTELTEATKADPGDFEAHLNRGRAQSELGRMVEAVQSYQKAIQLDPADPALKFTVYDNLGNVLASMKRLDEAVVQYRKALTLKPRSSSTHSNLATALIDLGRFDEAEAELIAAISFNQQSPVPKVNLAALYMKTDRHEQAVQILELAASTQGGSPLVIKNLALAYLKAGMKEEARAALNEFIRIYPAAEGSSFVKLFLEELNR